MGAPNLILAPSDTLPRYGPECTVDYLESAFTNVGNYLWIYFTDSDQLQGERSFSKRKMVEWLTKEHHETKQAEQSDSNEYSARTHVK